MASNGATNEIDFVLTNKKQIIKHAEIINNLEFDTDHRLVRIKIQTNKNKEKAKIFTNRICNTKQKVSKIKQFQQQLHTTLPDIEYVKNLDIQKIYNQIEKGIIQAATKISNILRSQGRI